MTDDFPWVVVLLMLWVALVMVFGVVWMLVQDYVNPSPSASVHEPMTSLPKPTQVGKRQGKSEDGSHE